MGVCHVTCLLHCSILLRYFQLGDAKAKAHVILFFIVLAIASKISTTSSCF